MSIRTEHSERVDGTMRHRDWMSAAEEEYRRLGTLLADLSEDDWRRPTDCDEWDVRQMVAHLVGAAEAGASVREALRQMKLGRRLRPGEPDVDGMNEVQVRERAERPPSSCVAHLPDAGARGVRAPPVPARRAARRPDPVRAAAGRQAAGLPHGPDLHTGCLDAPGGHLPHHRPARCCSRPSTTAGSSPTSSPSGPGRTAGRTGSS